MVPAIRPKILDNFYKKDEEIAGKIGGIVLNSSNMNKEELVENLACSIEKLKEDNTDTLIIEDFSMLNREDVQLIQTRTNLKVLDGKEAQIFFLPLVLSSIYQGLEENLKRKEALIIGDEEELIKELIEALYKEIRFITLVGEDEDSINRISKHVLEKTGLSISYSKNIDKILINYSIIINLKDKINIDMQKVRRGALVFDLSIKKGFCNINRNKRGPIIIEDLIFEINIGNKWIDDLVPSRVYECLYEFNPADLKGVLVNGSIYSINNLIGYEIKNKGKL